MNIYNRLLTKYYTVIKQMSELKVYTVFMTDDEVNDLNDHLSKDFSSLSDNLKSVHEKINYFTEGDS